MISDPSIETLIKLVKKMVKENEGIEKGKL